MTAEEFKEKFKVGDRVTIEWYKTEHYYDVLCIGEKKIFVKDENGLEEFKYFNEDWQHYKEPVKKDLEDHRLYYEVIQERYSVVLHPRFMDGKMASYLREENVTEILTEQEAIERGLKL